MKGEDVWVSGRVLGTDGKPVAERRARHLAGEGRRHLRRAGADAEFELRGRVKANAKGEYAFASYKPKFYSIPMDGPVGDLVAQTTNNHMRPAHMHAIVSAPGLPAGHHARLRRRRSVPRRRRGVRGEGFAGRQVQEGERRRRGEEARHAEPVPQARLRLPPLAGGQAKSRRARSHRPERRDRMIWRVRRVLTGHDAQGRSTFIADGLAPNVKEMPAFPGLALTDLWETKGAPAGERGRRRRRRPADPPRAAEERHHRPHRRVPARRQPAEGHRRHAPASRRSAPATRRTSTRPIR